MSLPHKSFSRRRPIGKQIDDPVTIHRHQSEWRPLTIIGIVPHTRNNAPGENDDPRNLPMMYSARRSLRTDEQNLMVRAKEGLNPHSLGQSDQRPNRSAGQRPGRFRISQRWRKTSTTALRRSV